MSWIKNVKHELGSFAIDIPAWEILERGMTVLWGPSGSGKTSILRLLLGLEGQGYDWSLGGVNVGHLAVREKRIGVVFQSYDLFPHMTAKENVEFAITARGAESKAVADRIAYFKEKLSLSSFWDRRASKLSGGEQQRIALVRALIAKPRALFLDEPFSALDESLRHESRKILKMIVELEQIPTILITHDRQDVLDLAEKVSVLDHGKIVRDLRCDEFVKFFGDLAVH
jgi:sulfate transport system ATP-binding protein/putative spermidine/putrescine transport system ATP-binding protein